MSVALYILSVMMVLGTVKLKVSSRAPKWALPAIAIADMLAAAAVAWAAAWLHAQ